METIFYKNVSIVLRGSSGKIMEVLDKILNASIELFRQYGFKTITMDDVARRAGISKKTLYQHFINKQEVVSETVIWYKDHVCSECDAMVASAGNAIEAMVHIIEMFDQANRQMNPLAMLELQRFFPEAYNLFREKISGQDVASMRDIIVRGINEGLFREEINADLMARYHIETSLMLMLQAPLLSNELYTLQSVSREIMEHFLYGLMTPKGEKLYHKYKDKYLKQPVKI